MNVFKWNPLFETGIELIDAQHRGLVEIINRLGSAVVACRADAASVEVVFQELADYAHRHFSDEERLMSAAQIDPQYFEHHQFKHREFVEQLRDLQTRAAGASESSTELLGFLAGWLTFHILDEDQAMVARIQGARARVAPEALAPNLPGAAANAVLLASMRELYRELAASNARLEMQVHERTRDLLQSEKMAAIGQLAAGVAHEMNNPLGFVISNFGTLSDWTRDLLGAIDRLADRSGEPGDLAGKVDSINLGADLPLLRSELGPLLADTQQGLQRVRHIVRALQGFAGDMSEGPYEYDLVEGLESAVIVVGSAIHEGVEIVWDLKPVPPVRCRPSAINQVFVSMLLNATQAIPDKGTITLRSGSKDDEVWIEICDSGAGIREEHLPRLFEPFFTTRPIGRGLGLGLTTAWDTVVNKHGGRIEVRSEPLAGSSFIVSLPHCSHNSGRNRADRETASPVSP